MATIRAPLLAEAGNRETGGSQAPSFQTARGDPGHRHHLTAAPALLGPMEAEVRRMLAERF